jgi:hypothetical protein
MMKKVGGKKFKLSQQREGVLADVKEFASDTRRASEAI